MIKTQRLTLRRLRKGDERRIFELLSERVVKYLDHVPWPYSKKDAENFVITSYDSFGKDFIYAITLDGDELIGVISIFKIFKGRAELGYWLGESYWGNGYMTEAVKGILDSFKGKLRLIITRTNTKNTGSQRVLEKCGFTRLGRIPRYYKTPLGEVGDAYFYYRVL